MNSPFFIDRLLARFLDRRGVPSQHMGPLERLAAAFDCKVMGHATPEDFALIQHAANLARFPEDAVWVFAALLDDAYPEGLTVMQLVEFLDIEPSVVCDALALLKREGFVRENAVIRDIDGELATAWNYVPDNYWEGERDLIVAYTS